MKGPYQRLKYDLRRLWECPACKRRERTAGTVTFRHCLCKLDKIDGKAVVMKLIEDGVQRTEAVAMPHDSPPPPQPPISQPARPQMNIRPVTASDREKLADLWLRSVRATHSFLSEDDIQFFLPLVRKSLAAGELEVWILSSADTPLIGFMGLAANKVEALFVDPNHLRQGGGRLLVEYARRLKGELTVDVNEQNPAACRFYEACGFIAVGRSEFDSTGKPFPLVHMRLTV